MSSTCSTCRDSGFVVEVFDEGFGFAPAPPGGDYGQPCPDCVACWCDERGIRPHPKDVVGDCKCCKRRALQKFDARVIGADEEDRLRAYTQRTCGLCSNTYYSEPGPPLPACFDGMEMQSLELRSEAFAPL